MKQARNKLIKGDKILSAILGLSIIMLIVFYCSTPNTAKEEYNESNNESTYQVSEKEMQKSIKYNTIKLNIEPKVSLDYYIKNNKLYVTNNNEYPMKVTINYSGEKYQKDPIDEYAEFNLSSDSYIQPKKTEQLKFDKKTLFIRNDYSCMIAAGEYKPPYTHGINTDIKYTFKENDTLYLDKYNVEYISIEMKTDKGLRKICIDTVNKDNSVDFIHDEINDKHLIYSNKNGVIDNSTITKLKENNTTTNNSTASTPKSSTNNYSSNSSSNDNYNNSSNDDYSYNNSGDDTFDCNDDVTTNQPSKGYVYWTRSGKSYHSRKSCPTLKRSKVIYEGYNCPKTDPCNICY